MNPVTETELKAKAVAPRVTLDYLTSLIAGIHYFTAADGVDGDYLNTKRAADAYNRVTLGPLKDDKPIEGTPMGDLALLTFCVIRLRNGFIVHGISACADPANFNQEIGQRLAHQNAINQIWPLLGYELKTQLHYHHLNHPQGAGLAVDAGAEPQASVPSNPEGAGPATVETTFKDRLFIEHDDLELRLTQLCKFLVSPQFEFLGPEARGDLIEQAHCMQPYLTVLKRRIARG